MSWSESKQYLSSIEEILEDARSGKLFILTDSEDRENEGDFVVLGEKVDHTNMNFMINHGSGIVCLAIEQSVADNLGLGLMARSNVGPNYTAFTTSIDARFGISTGVSALDRAKTVSVAVSAGATGADVVTPGHVFPLIAKTGGVLARPGHTEASVEIAKLAGFRPAAVICEAINRDGTMSRLRDLIAFGKEYGIRIATIDSLIAYLKLKNQ